MKYPVSARVAFIDFVKLAGTCVSADGGLEHVYVVETIELDVFREFPERLAVGFESIHYALRASHRKIQRKISYVRADVDDFEMRFEQLKQVVPCDIADGGEVYGVIELLAEVEPVSDSTPGCVSEIPFPVEVNRRYQSPPEFRSAVQNACHKESLQFRIEKQCAKQVEKLHTQGNGKRIGFVGAENDHGLCLHRPQLTRLFQNIIRRVPCQAPVILIHTHFQPTRATGHVGGIQAY